MSFLRGLSRVICKGFWAVLRDPASDSGRIAGVCQGGGRTAQASH